MRLSALIAALAGFASGCAPLTYRLTEIGPGFRVKDMNAAGQIVGEVGPTIDQLQPFLWDPGRGAATILTTTFIPCAGQQSVQTPSWIAWGVNAAGVVVGEASDGVCNAPGSPAVQGRRYFAVRWPAPATANVPQLIAGSQNQSHFGSTANAINDQGDVVGAHQIRFAGLKDTGHPRQWTTQGNSFFLVPEPPFQDGVAIAINNAGVIAGTLHPYSTARAMYWHLNGSSNGLIPFPPGTWQENGVNDLSDRNDAVGYAKQGAVRRAFMVKLGDPVAVDLGVLYGLTGEESEAIGVNNLRQVVGFNSKPPTATNPDYVDEAFIWDAAFGMRNLNALIFPCDARAGKVRLSGAHAINDRGEIAAHGFNLETGAYGAYHLKPTTERCE